MGQNINQISLPINDDIFLDLQRNAELQYLKWYMNLLSAKDNQQQMQLIP